MRGKSTHLYRLGKDEQGVTIVEFALISPVFMFLLMGTFDIGYAVYMRSTLNGAIQQAARDSSLQDATVTATRAEIDAKVTDIIQTINRDATVTVKRTNYQAYADVDRLEDYDDDNLNGTCDDNESYADSNANDIWDKISGAAGVGGARDSVLYTITVQYNTLFPFSGYKREAAAKKITGYETRTRTKVIKVPGERRAVRLPIYENVKIADDNGPTTIRVPKYEWKATDVGTREVPIYKNTEVALRGNRTGTMEVPVYKIYQTGEKKHRVPITELVEVPRKGNPSGEVEMPIYEFVVATRNTGKTVVDYEDVKLPVYTNVITQTERGPTLRRVLVRYETVRRAKLDTKRKIITGDRDYIQRKLIGYQTVYKPKVVLVQKVIGYKTITNPTYTRRQIRTEIVPRPTTTLKRELIGYKTQKVQKTERVLTGYSEVVVASDKIQRRLVGYKTVVKQMPSTATRTVTETYQAPVFETRNAAFQLSGISNTRTMTAQTLLKNQPYGDQTARTTNPGNCT
jgi:Flp pilus assembly protein TadG